MPTYEYACRACGEHLEVVQSFADPPLSQCPACGGQLRKVFGNVGIVLKGSGFYRTDSRQSDGKRPETAKADGAKADGAKADAKPEGSPGAKDAGAASSPSQQGAGAAPHRAAS
jgi:putative FmdB family regulatory protein